MINVLSLKNEKKKKELGGVGFDTAHRKNIYEDEGEV